MSPSVGLVLPAYRSDADRLSRYVRSIREALGPVTVRIELDAPGGSVPEAIATLPVQVNAVDHRRGKGAAITDGFEALSTDVLAFADADGATPADSVADVVAPVRAGAADLAAGSRRHPDSTVHSHQTRTRRHLGDLFAWLARRLLAVDLYDYQCGAKAIDADAWRAVRTHLHEPGFAWDVELIAIAAAVDLRVREVPIEWHDRPGSTVSPVRDSLRLGRALLTARHRAKRIGDDPLHEAVAARREGAPPLVEEE